MKLKSQLLLIGLGLLLFVFFWIWPGVYRYNYCTIQASRTEYDEKPAQIKRVDRLTGHVQSVYSQSYY